MKNTERLKFYPPLEEKINVATHAFGFMASIFALVILVLRANLYGNVYHIISASLYGVSLIVLYAASTIFHNTKDKNLRFKLNIFDHSSIFVLIAGTYTPIALITLHGTVGWIIFGVIWGLALTGIIMKFFFIGKYRLVSTIMYVLMGWIAVLVIKPLINNLAIEGLIWLLVGGISYTIGAFLYSSSKIKFNHAIFHVFVLIGSFCHFITIYLYVLPVK
ncbi:MAG: hemolysin III family protein [Bacteroidales bacterium]|jgi:hemolysin III|nr:hemolysin III family protein [Bacteroidales bacterium]